MEKFWTVFVEGSSGGYGRQHSSRQSAKEEAARLIALEHKRVFILELVDCGAPSTTPVWSLIGDKDLGQEKPFRQAQDKANLDSIALLKAIIQASWNDDREKDETFGGFLTRAAKAVLTAGYTKPTELGARKDKFWDGKDWNLEKVAEKHGNHSGGYGRGPKRGAAGFTERLEASQGAWKPPAPPAT